jgi:hypothetical protein
MERGESTSHSVSLRGGLSPGERASLVEVSRDYEGRMTFEIGGAPPEIDRQMTSYRSGLAEVNAQRFIAEIRRLKGLIHGSD